LSGRWVPQGTGTFIANLVVIARIIALANIASPVDAISARAPPVVEAGAMALACVTETAFARLVAGPDPIPKGHANLSTIVIEVFVGHPRARRDAVG
jgi:hypothetical protein